MLIEIVEKYSILEGLLDCDKIVVGFSGGPDSVALLVALDEISKRLSRKFQITAVHVNHNIRGEDALADEKFVRDFCDERSIELIVVSKDVPRLAKDNSRGLEEMGRMVRYSAFKDVRDRLAAGGSKVYIATAHHKDDAAETMLLNLMRGTGLEGLSSMEPLSSGIIRPMLCVSKAEIMDFLDSRGISYCVDSSNDEAIYTRNFVRNEVIPKLKEGFDRDPIDAMDCTRKLLQEDLEIIEDYVDSVYSEVVSEDGGNYIQISLFNELRPAIKGRIIRKLYKETFGETVDFGSVHVESVKALVSNNAHEGKTIDLPFDRICYILSGAFGFCERRMYKSVLFETYAKRGFLLLEDAVSTDIAGLASGRKTLEMPNSTIKISASIVENIEGLEYNKFSWFLPVEQYQELSELWLGNSYENKDLLGAVMFRRAGSKHAATLNRTLIDAKITSLVRGHLVFVAKAGEALWVPGLGCSIGFVNDLARKKYFASYDRFVRISIEIDGHAGGREGEEVGGQDER